MWSKRGGHAAAAAEAPVRKVPVESEVRQHREDLPPDEHVQHEAHDEWDLGH